MCGGGVRLDRERSLELGYGIVDAPGGQVAESEIDAEARIFRTDQEHRFVTGDVLAKHFRREIGVECRAIGVAGSGHLQPQVPHFRGDWSVRT